MLFSVSGVETSLFLPPLAAFGISLLTSMGGISGAFLLLPFQISVLGFTSPAVSATNQVYNLVATPGGFVRYAREGRMLRPLSAIAIAGSLPGVIIGAIIRLEYLADIAMFKTFAAGVLLYLAIRLAKTITGHASKAEAPGKERPQLLESSIKKVRFLFQAQEYEFPPARVFALTTVIGIVGGIYGIGGGAMLAPFLVSSFRLPIHVVAGPTLLCTFVTSLGGVCAYLGLAPFYPNMTVGPDWLLGCLFGIGGFAGAYAGAGLQKYLPSRPIILLLGLLVTGMGLSWLLPVFFQ